MAAKYIKVASAEEVREAICLGAWVLVGSNFVNPAHVVEVTIVDEATGEYTLKLSGGQTVTVDPATDAEGAGTLFVESLTVVQV